MKKIFISFFHSKGVGNCITEIDYELDGEEIRNLEKQIMDEKNITGVVILNIIPLPIK